MNKKMTAKALNGDMRKNKSKYVLFTEEGCPWLMGIQPDLASVIAIYCLCLEMRVKFFPAINNYTINYNVTYMQSLKNRFLEKKIPYSFHVITLSTSRQFPFGLYDKTMMGQNTILLQFKWGEPNRY